MNQFTCDAEHNHQVFFPAHSKIIFFAVALKRFHLADCESMTFKVMICYNHVYGVL